MMSAAQGLRSCWAGYIATSPRWPADQWGEVLARAAQGLASNGCALSKEKAQTFEGLKKLGYAFGLMLT